VPGVPRQKKFIEDFESEKNVTIDEIYDDDMTTTIGRERLEFLLEKENPFPYPKPPKLIYFLISCVQTKKITVLDFFAGSGTTADAISMFEDKNINFILCTNNENNICDEITYPRISKIINKNNVAYFKTSLVPHKQKICDTDRSTFTKAVGELIGLKENTIETVKLNSYYHILNNRKRSKCTLIYFNEDLYK
jgi:adenine-specific DNA-methyltransferase